MKIEAGNKSPVFIVRDATNGAVFKGPTPTAPWTSICKKLFPGKNTRVSGPLVSTVSDTADVADVWL